ncbi:MAG: DUF1570 domain-containing protein [Phycisphaerales bacterium]|nr:DUF1570 domain-containing protein [Phycisphaerales bacterium]
MPRAPRLSVLLMCAASLGALHLTQQARGATPPGGGRESPARAALERGWQAMQAGHLREADLWLRAAWTHEETRGEAAESLWSLQQDPDFDTDAEEKAVGEVEAALGPAFRRMESAHFVVLSDSDPEWVRSRLAMMEHTRREFFRVARSLNLPVVPHERKLLCILIESYDDFIAYSAEHDGISAAWIAGYYSLPHNRVVFYNDVNGPAFSPRLETLAERHRASKVRHAGAAAPTGAHEARDPARETEQAMREVERLASDFSVAKTVHETVHLLSFNTGLQSPSRAYPIWLSEGLASNFETPDTSGTFGPGMVSSERERTFARLLESGRLMPLGRLVGLAEVPPDETQAVEQVYAQAHVLFAHLYATRRVSLGRYFEDLSARTGSTSAADHVRIFERCFGTVRDIEEELASSARKAGRR